MKSFFLRSQFKINFTKKIRKSYLASILASLTLFASCSQYDNDIQNSINSTDNINLEKNSGNINLDSFVEKQLQTSTEIINLLEKENNIDFESLEYVSKDLKPEDLLIILEDANIQKSDVISNLLIQLYNESVNFGINNPDFKNLNQNEIEKMINVEINNQHNKLDGFNPCRDVLDIAKARCGENLLIALAAAALVGIFTGGVGYGFGAATAILIAAKCATDADNDYNACMGY